MYAGALFLLILSVAAIMATILLSRQTRGYSENTISVTGQAKVDSAPDVATFSFMVKETATTTEDAQEVISEKITTILDALDELDVAKDDIKTNSYTMYPKYEYVKVAQSAPEIAPDGTRYFPGNDRKQVQVGFDVSQQVSVKIRDFDQVPGALTAFGNLGVENLNGPNFQIDDPSALEEEAKKMAIRDAKEKAKRLTDELGVRLGKIISFNENGGYYPQPYMTRGTGMEMMAMDMAEEESFVPQLPTGENTVNANVTIIYKIK